MNDISDLVENGYESDVEDALGNSADNDESDIGHGGIADVHCELRVDGHYADRPDLHSGLTPPLMKNDDACAASGFQALDGPPQKKQRLLCGNLKGLICNVRRD